MQRIQKLVESSTNFIFSLIGQPSAKSKVQETKSYAETDMRVGVMDELAEELMVVTQIFIDRDKKNRHEKERVLNTLSKPEYTAALQRMQAKGSKKTTSSVSAGNDEELYGRLQELVAAYPVESPDLEEIRKHHAMLCEALGAYLGWREEHDHEFEEQRTFNDVYLEGESIYATPISRDFVR